MYINSTQTGWHLIVDEYVVRRGACMNIISTQTGWHFIVDEYVVQRVHACM